MNSWNSKRDYLDKIESILVLDKDEQCTRTKAMLTFDVRDGRIGGVDDIAVQDMDVGMDLLVETTEPDGADAEVPVEIRVTGSDHGVAIDLVVALDAALDHFG